MKKTIQMLTLTVAAIGLTAGAAIAADETHATTGAGIETQANVDIDTTASSNAQVESVQASLAQEGYAVSVDGVWGPQSAEALRQFQQANNLDATGQIDAQTLAALNVDASASQGTAMGESRSW